MPGWTSHPETPTCTKPTRSDGIGCQALDLIVPKLQPCLNCGILEGTQQMPTFTLVHVPARQKPRLLNFFSTITPFLPMSTSQVYLLATNVSSPLPGPQAMWLANHEQAFLGFFHSPNEFADDLKIRMKLDRSHHVDKTTATLPYQMDVLQVARDAYVEGSRSS